MKQMHLPLIFLRGLCLPPWCWIPLRGSPPLWEGKGILWALDGTIWFHAEAQRKSLLVLTKGSSCWGHDHLIQTLASTQKVHPRGNPSGGCKVWVVRAWSFYILSIFVSCHFLQCKPPSFYSIELIIFLIQCYINNNYHYFFYPLSHF